MVLHRAIRVHREWVCHQDRNHLSTEPQPEAGIIKPGTCFRISIGEPNQDGDLDSELAGLVKVEVVDVGTCHADLWDPWTD